MKKLILLFILTTVSVNAQEPVPATATAFLSWNQTANSLTEANSFVYKIYVDSNPSVVLKHTCITDGSGILCNAQLPALTVGVHSFNITASDLAAEGEHSATVSVRIYLAPLAPTNLKIVIK